MAEYIMTDSEIIKALECCIKCDCKNCPANVDNKCRDIDYVKILNLINRLQAENERLKEEKEKCFYCTEQANKKISEIKAEAYKECIEKVKEKIYTAHFGGRKPFCVTTINPDDLDNL